MTQRIRLPLALLLVGLVLTGVHDYTYRRVDDGTGDYELWGAVSHAGSDMLIVTFALVLVAWLWPSERR